MKTTLKSKIRLHALSALAALSLLSGCTEAVHERTQSSNTFFGGGTCEEVLLKQYKSSVYPFFRSSSTCIGCHIEGGPGLGLFASSAPEVSFASFTAAGLSKVSYMATNQQHKPPYTGLQNKSAIDVINQSWVGYQNEYLDCLSKSENGGVNESLLTSQKGAPAIYAGAAQVETLTWDLDMASDLDESVSRSVPARITIDVRVLYQTVEGRQIAKGYIFSNPTLQMKDPTKQLVVEGLFFHINGQPISSQTTFTNLSRVVSGSTAVPLMNAQANTLIEPMSTRDVFQLYIRRIVLTSGTDNTAPPLTPILRLADSETGSSTLLKSANVDVSILRDAGILRWCLSEAPSKPASTESPCVNALSGVGIVNGWHTSRPSSYRFSAGDGAKRLYLWVADQNLKINEAAAVVDVTLDTLAPLAPVIASITVTDTQVAAMSVSHVDEADVTGWCVIERGAIAAAPARPELDDRCWKWSENSAKPTTVGFKEGGSRNVWVFVRDRAGNVSNASDPRAATNPFGAITFSQLTSSTGGPRAIFYNRCNTCHGSSANPGYSKLRLFVFADAVGVASTGVLVSRINNPISPMPNINGGLMPQRDRDLIKLWTLPEEGDTPLP